MKLTSSHIGRLPWDSLRLLEVVGGSLFRPSQRMPQGVTIVGRGSVPGAREGVERRLVRAVLQRQPVSCQSFSTLSSSPPLPTTTLDGDSGRVRRLR